MNQLNLVSFLNKDLIFCDVNVADQQELFAYANKQFLKFNCVKDTYLDAIIEREKSFSTGLKFESINIAIPHTIPAHIVKPFISVVKLVKPIEFCEMGTNDSKIGVQWCFLLGVTDPDEQLTILQTLMKIFQSEDNVEKLRSADSTNKIFDVLVSVFK